MSFKCLENCGKCCGIMPLEKDFVERNKDKFVVTPKEISEVEDVVAVFTEDGGCVFLDRQTKKCVVYDDRPEVCRLFGTSKTNPDLMCMFLKPNGNPRSIAKQKQLDRRLEKIVNRMRQGVL